MVEVFCDEEMNSAWRFKSVGRGQTMSDTQLHVKDIKE